MPLKFYIKHLPFKNKIYLYFEIKKVVTFIIVFLFWIFMSREENKIA